MIEALLYSALLMGLLPVGIYYAAGKKTSAVERPVLPYLWLVAFASAYELIGTICLGWSSARWFTIYDLLEFCSLFYYLKGMVPQKLRVVPYIFAVLFLGAYTVINLDGFGGLEGKSVLSSITFPFVFLTLTLWLHRQLREKKELVLATPAAQWVLVLALLSYYTLTYFLYFLGFSLYKMDNDAFMFYWQINIIVTLAFRLALATAVWKMQNR